MTRDGGVIPLPDGILPCYWQNMSEGLIAVRDKKTELYGYADRNGNIVIPPAYEQAEQFENGKAEVQAWDKTLFIDHEGNVIQAEP